MDESAKNLFGLATEDLAHVLRHAEDDLRKMRGARVLLTGGTGFFGKWLLAAFVQANAEFQLGLRVTVLSRDPAAFLLRHPEIGRAGIEFQQGDVAGLPASVAAYDYVIHAATDTSGIVTAGQEAERERTIVEGTRRVLDAARTGGAKRILLLSSGGVYGVSAARPGGAREDDPTEALTAYGRAKRASEKLGEGSGLDVVIARGFAFLGPLLPLDTHYAAGNFLRDAHRGVPIRVRGDGTAQRSYLYPSDLVIWLLKILHHGRRGRAYNVGSDETVTTAQLAQIISEACPARPEVIIEHQQPQGPANIYLPHLARSRDELGLRVLISLREAAKKTLRFLGGE